MKALHKGRYRARFAVDMHDVRAAQDLRALVFRQACVGRGSDRDRFDHRCQHVLIDEVKTGRLVACFRLLPLRNGHEIDRSYSAQFYDLAGLQDFKRPMAEIGRFCLHPEVFDPDILRIAWAMIARFVDANEIEMLFGCSSFPGTTTETYADTFALLKQKYLAPERWRPGARASQVVSFSRSLPGKPDLRCAIKAMPPLLRSYLAMGGRVSDHAVVDCDLNTLHVFTGLKVTAIPAARVRALRKISM